MPFVVIVVRGVIFIDAKTSARPWFGDVTCTFFNAVRLDRVALAELEPAWL